MTIREYIKQTLEECPNGDVYFDIGVGVNSPSGHVYVEGESQNRIKFTIIKKDENKLGAFPRLRETKISKLSEAPYS